MLFRLISLSVFGIALVVFSTIGCATGSNKSGLPGRQRVVREQLIVHSDFSLPSNHRLIEELTSRRHEIAELLEVPMSDEAINVYLFEDEAKFRNFMKTTHPEFPNRRAFFVKDDTSLNVYAFWGSRIGEDLRHEVTHGYLHSVVPNLPLWLDEGIAEYFEIGRGKGGLNGPHVYHLSNELRRGNWSPDLARLEAIESASSLTQMDYAESWLWVHFLLSGDSQSRAVIQNHLAQLIQSGSADPILPQIQNEFPDFETQLVLHLNKLEASR